MNLYPFLSKVGACKKSLATQGRSTDLQQSDMRSLQQDLVLGVSPLKLLQQNDSSGMIEKDESETVPDEEPRGYRSFPLEHFKFAEDECERKTMIEKGSASFPGAFTCKRACETMMKKELVQRQVVDSASQNEEDTVENDDDGDDQEDVEDDSSGLQEGLEWLELQHKVHILEHIYNGECFLKVSRNLSIIM